MTDKLLLQNLMCGYYICKRQSRDKRFGYALYVDNMNLVALITTKQYHRHRELFKEHKGRVTLNLRTVRSQHGKSISKQVYKSVKKLQCNIPTAV